MISRTRNLFSDADRELIELGREFARLHEIAKVAHEKAAAATALYESRLPSPSHVMRHTIEDLWTYRFPIIDLTEPICADDRLHHNPFYTEAEIELLSHAPLPADAGAIPAQKARATEITREWRRWKRQCDRLRQRLGFDVSRERALDYACAAKDVADKIAALPARTAEGLKIRAAVLKSIFSEERDDDAPEASNVWAMISDIEAIVSQQCFATARYDHASTKGSVEQGGGFGRRLLHLDVRCQKPIARRDLNT